MSQATNAKHEKHERELKKWKKAAAKPTPAGYLIILVVIVALVYIVDELTSNITATVQVNITAVVVSSLEGVTAAVAYPTLWSTADLSAIDSRYFTGGG